MKRIKSYQLFLENKSQLESVVIEFLIYNERKLGLYFDRFDLITFDRLFICNNWFDTIGL